MVNARDLKHALGHCTGLIECDGTDAREHLHVARALDKYSRFTRTADAGKECERNTDNKSARAADNKEGKRAVDPAAPVTAHAH